MAMRFTLQLLSAAVVALVLGFFALLLLPDPLRVLSAAFADPSHALLPGGSAYLFLQLLFAMIAAALAFGCLLRTRGKFLATIATITCVFAILLVSLDFFWFSLLVIVQSAGFLWFQFTQRSKPAPE
jgi:hypothetical protein